MFLRVLLKQHAFYPSLPATAHSFGNIREKLVCSDLAPRLDLCFSSAEQPSSQHLLRHLIQVIIRFERMFSLSTVVLPHMTKSFNIA